MNHPPFATPLGSSMSPKKISRAVHDLDVVRSFLDVSTVVYGIVCVAGGAGKSGDFGEGFYVGQSLSNWINNTPDQRAFITFFNR
jgi:hypothetical protein